MKLGTYTFEWLPDNWTEPKKDRLVDVMKTFSSAIAFSWGATLIGKEISLEWEWMSREMWAELRAMEEADAPLAWDPEQIVRLWHGAVTNGPFIVGRTLTGGTSGHSGVIAAVGDGFVTMNSATGLFIPGETLTDAFPNPDITAVLSTAEQAPALTVEITKLEGDLAEVTAYEAGRRMNVKMILAVMAEV